MKKILFFLLACSVAVQSFAQQLAFSGKVLDETGSPVIGAIVKVQGDNTSGVATDVNGAFKIQASAGAHLLISYISYTTKDIVVRDAKTALTITLEPTNSSLDEVVVVGYGSVKKATLTGAVVSISGKELTATPNENLINSMSGKLSGVRIVQNTSQPGQYASTFDIRGFSYNPAKPESPLQPLVIVDGVPSDLGVLQRIDSHEIESVSVLKDASAAVYGVKAANGVVLVTTKRGKAGKATITYSGYAGLQVMNKVPAVANAIEWMTLSNEFNQHSTPTNPTIIYPVDQMELYRNGTLQSTDWRDVTLKKSTPQWNHNLSISGGNDKVNYFTSIGYNKQMGIYKSDDLYDDKYNFRSNVDSKIANGLTASIQLSGMADIYNAPLSNPSDMFQSLTRNTPITPVYVANNPKYLYNTNVRDGLNTIALTDSEIGGYQLNKRNDFHGGLSLNYDTPFLRGLSAKVFYNFDYSIQDNKKYQKTWYAYVPPAATPNSQDPTTYTRSTFNSPAFVNRSYGQSQNGFLQFSLHYAKTINLVHNIDVLALYEQNSSSNDGFYAQRDEILNSDQLSAGAANSRQVGTQNGTAGKSSLQSYVAKLHYDYKSKYLIDLTARRDGSSLFPPNKQFGIFPAVQAAYRISEESFIKGNESLSFIDNIKIRGSYGVLGDASGANGYSFISGYDYPIGNPNAQNLPIGSVFDNGFVNGLGFRALPNPDITWFEAKTTNVGIDAEFWKGLFGFSVEYFNRTRTGLLGTLLLTVPSSVGASLPQVNLNSDQTRGVEVTLTSNMRVGQVSLNMTGNVSFTRTKWLHYERAHLGSDQADWYINNDDGNSGFRDGRYNDVYFGYGYVGQYQSFNQIRAYNVNNGASQNRTAVPGDYIYEDWNGDGAINDQDRHPIGTSGPTPLLNFGYNIQARYKNFDMNAQLQGAAMKNVVYGIWYSYPLDHNGNAFAYFLDRWHPANPTANPFDPNTQYVPGYFAFTGTNVDQKSLAPNALQNATYVRLKSIELGYTLPSKISQKAGISRLRFFASGYNLLTITGMKFGDPEKPSENNSSDYPLNHTFNFGVNATF